MPIDLFWDNDAKTIIRADFIGQWSWEEYHDTALQMKVLNEGIEHPVHQIVNMTQTTYVPPQASTLDLRTGRSQDPPNFALSIVVNPPTAARSLMTVVDAVYSDEVQSQRVVAQSLAEAYELIERYQRDQSSETD